MINRRAYVGYSLSEIDDYLNVEVPRDFRSVIKHNSGISRMLVGMHRHYPCLTFVDCEWKQQQLAQVTARALATGSEEDWQEENNGRRYIFGITKNIAIHSGSRIRIPRLFYSYAQLQTDALFIATGSGFEIWNPEILIRTAGIDQQIKNLCDYLVRQKEFAKSCSSPPSNNNADLSEQERNLPLMPFCLGSNRKADQVVD